LHCTRGDPQERIVGSRPRPIVSLLKRIEADVRERLHPV
jgi:hypothetical protein